MRHEAVRNELGKARRTGRPLTEAEHLALHEATFRAGAQAMADAVGAELESLRMQEAEELDEAKAGGKIVGFPFPGTTQRFTTWPTGHVSAEDDGKGGGKR